MDHSLERIQTLFVHTPIDPPLGADVWVHAQIVRNLDRRHHKVHIALSRRADGQSTPLERQLDGVEGLEILEVDPGPEKPNHYTVSTVAILIRQWLVWLGSLLRLAAYIRRRKINVLHTCDRPRDAFTVVMLGRILRVPSIVHVHVAPGDWMSRVRRWAIDAATCRIAVSEFVRESLIEAGCSATDTHTILNGVDLERWRSDSDADRVRDDLGIARSQPILLSVCRLFEAKGALELIRAFAIADVDFAVLLIAGVDSTPEQEYLRQLEGEIRRLGLEDSVRLLGWRNDVVTLMSMADVFAMPSTGEPCALVYLEAMAMGLPVVALADGGTPELVTHSVEGLLSAHGDLPTLADNVRRLLVDADARRAMGERGRARVEEHFSVARQADDVAKLYKSVIMQASGSSVTEVGR